MPLSNVTRVSAAGFVAHTFKFVRRCHGAVLCRPRCCAGQPFTKLLLRKLQPPSLCTVSGFQT
eukprot:415216-Hanusia_phi.AAC.2